MKLRRGDQVQVMTGKDRGKRGKVLRVVPVLDRVVVEGVNIQKRHVRSRQSGKAGERVERPGALHISNVMLICPETDKPTRVGYIWRESTKARVSKRSNKEI